MSRHHKLQADHRSRLALKHKLDADEGSEEGDSAEDEAAAATLPGPRSLRRYAGLGPGVLGIVRKWDQDKGFGFIELSSGEGDIFVGRAALPDSGRGWNVTPGQELVFDVERTADGKERAARVTGPALHRTADISGRGLIVRPGAAANNPTGHRPRPVNIWAGTKEHDERIHKAMQRERERDRKERDKELQEATLGSTRLRAPAPDARPAEKRRRIEEADEERAKLRRELLERKEAERRKADLSKQECLLRVTKPEGGRLGARLKGTVVTKVRPGSAAESAGLAPGMRLCEVEGSPVTGRRDVLAAIGAAPRAFTITVDHVAVPPTVK